MESNVILLRGIISSSNFVSMHTTLVPYVLEKCLKIINNLYTGENVGVTSENFIVLILLKWPLVRGNWVWVRFLLPNTRLLKTLSRGGKINMLTTFLLF